MEAVSTYLISPEPSFGLTLALSVRPSESVVSYSTSYEVADEPRFDAIVPIALTPEPSSVLPRREHGIRLAQMRVHRLLFRGRTPLT